MVDDKKLRVCPIAEICPKGERGRCSHATPHYDRDNMCLRAGCHPEGHKDIPTMNWKDIVCVEVPDVAV